MRGCVGLLFFVALIFSSCARTPKEPPYVRRPSVHKETRIVVLDPGHGGHNSGTKMVIAPFTKEKDLALQTALKVRDHLEHWGYSVRLTRTKDVFIPLDKRVSFAKEVHGSLFVSLHYNHAPNKQANGVEIFYYAKKGEVERSKRLAQAILDSLVKNAKVASRGVQKGDYHVIRENSMPAVLVEGGFFSNVAEAKMLSKPAYINKLAYSIAKGIDNYMRG